MTLYKRLTMYLIFLVFVGNVKENLNIFFSRVSEENDSGASSSKKICQNVSCPPQKVCFLHHFDICDKSGDHTTDIDLFLLGKKFDISISDKFADQKEQVFSDVLCHVHYNVLNNLKREKECFVCEKSSRTSRFVFISKENVDIFLKYLKFELNFDADIDVAVNIFCCPACYNSFNTFCRSDTGEEAMFQTFQYINTCLHRYKFKDPVSQDNVDLYTLQEICEFITELFMNEKVILLPDLFEKYKKKLEINIKNHKFSVSDIDMKKLEHSSKWLLRLLKIRFGKGLQVYVAKKKKNGSMLYRNGMDLLNCIHTLTVDYQNVVSQKKEEIANYSNKNAILISEKNVKPSKQTILNEAVTILRLLVKMYTSGKTSLTCLPDIHKLVHLMRLIKYHQFYGIFYLG